VSKLDLVRTSAISYIAGTPGAGAADDIGIIVINSTRHLKMILSEAGRVSSPLLDHTTGYRTASKITARRVKVGVRFGVGVAEKVGRCSHSYGGVMASG